MDSWQSAEEFRDGGDEGKGAKATSRGGGCGERRSWDQSAALVPVASLDSLLNHAHVPCAACADNATAVHASSRLQLV